jgi:polar amino acid transport system permease protein
MKYQWDFSLVMKYMPFLLKGAIVTIELTILTIVIGTLLGIIFAMLLRSKIVALRWFARVYVEVFLAIPVLVLLVWLYYCLPILLPRFTLDSFSTAVIGLTLSLTAFVAEIVRGGIDSVPFGQIEAGLTVGLSMKQVYRHIILPQALRTMTPPLLTQYITVLKLSSLASVIAVYELLHSGQTLITHTFRPLEVYTIVALIYVGMVWILIAIVRRIEALKGWRIA